MTFNVLVDLEYQKFYPNIQAELPQNFIVNLADLSPGNENNESLNDLLKQTDAIIGQVNLSDEHYQIAAQLKIIQTLSAGYDRINLDRAKKNKVIIANNNGANAISVAEHVLMQIFALYRQLLFHHHSVKVGPWKNNKHSNREFYGKTLGIFGLGHIGKTLTQRALALGVKVQYFDIVRQEEKESNWGIKYLFPDELLATSDIVSYHVPKTKFTKNMINQDSLSKMQPDSLLINAARGDLQDENAIYQALTSGQISGAGLDVFQVEPIPKQSPLKNLDNVILTPHSAPTQECYPRAVHYAVQNIERIASGKAAQSIAVNHDHVTQLFLQNHPEIKLGNI